jgi:hypothetical protein
MQDRKRCWFRQCLAAGLPRPLFAQVHDLPATLRLCERHMHALAAEPRRARAQVIRPFPTQ